MKNLAECKEDIHSCSKCGLCQSVCPIYKITGNDCTVSRGHFIMLQGVINGELKMSKTINKYLDLCLKCNACSKFCPSGIDVVNIVALAKAEYFKTHSIEKFISWIQKTFIFNFGLGLLSFFSKKEISAKFDKKVVYFGGCGSKIEGNASVVKILNSCGIEVITPNFNCCGIPFFVRGDLKTYEDCMKSFFEKIKNTGITEVVTTCASCEKRLKTYEGLEEAGIKIKNIFEYIKENNLHLKLKKKIKVTFHKPCNISNFEDIKQILENTENLEYTEMEDFDKCCGLNGILKISEYNIMKNIFLNKRRTIIETGAKNVLTSCLGCKTALKIFSFGRYKVDDITDFLGKNV